MDIVIATQREFEVYATQTRAYFYTEEYDSDFFQRFLLKHDAIKARLAEKLEELECYRATVEIRHNADNPHEIILIVSEEVKHQIHKHTSID